MEWTMLCYDGTEYTLPTPVAWRLNYGLGTPCDSVWVKTLVGGAGEPAGRWNPAAGDREGGDAVFRGD